MAPKDYHALKHSDLCERGATDPLKRVWGEADPDCAKCKAWAEIRASTSRRLFA